jgi:histone H3/H4
MADVLVVSSKVKKYIKDKADMNTSASTIDALSAVVARLCDEAIERAKADGRKTVKDRDVSS